MRELTKEEESAIRRLKSVAKIWPSSLWLFSASGSLCVMGKDEENNRVYLPFCGTSGQGGGVDDEYTITTIGIENDGGDW